MLSFTESIRPTAPSMQRVCRAVEDARARTELLPTAWTLTRVLTVDIIESVLEGVSELLTSCQMGCCNPSSPLHSVLTRRPTAATC
jgi:hypothetical protein